MCVHVFIWKKTWRIIRTEGNNKTISNKFDIKENRIITDFDDITKGVKFSIYRCPNKT